MAVYGVMPSVYGTWLRPCHVGFHISVTLTKSFKQMQKTHVTIQPRNMHDNQALATSMWSHARPKCNAFISIYPRTTLVNGDGCDNWLIYQDHRTISDHQIVEKTHRTISLIAKSPPSNTTGSVEIDWNWSCEHRWAQSDHSEGWFFVGEPLDKPGWEWWEPSQHGIRIDSILTSDPGW